MIYVEQTYEENFCIGVFKTYYENFVSNLFWLTVNVVICECSTQSVFSLPSDYFYDFFNSVKYDTS